MRFLHRYFNGIFSQIFQSHFEIKMFYDVLTYITLIEFYIIYIYIRISMHYFFYRTSLQLAIDEKNAAIIKCMIKNKNLHVDYKSDPEIMRLLSQ